MKLEKETSVFKRDAIKNGIALAKKKATDFLTELANGIFVHAEGTPSDPTDSQAEGVRITDSIDIIHDGESVASYGTEARIGSASSGNLLARSNGVVVRDGLTELAQFSSGSVYLSTADGTFLLRISDDGSTASVYRIYVYPHDISMQSINDVATFTVDGLRNVTQGTTIKVKLRGAGGTHGKSLTFTDAEFTYGTADSGQDVCEYNYDGAFIPISIEYDGDETFTVWHVHFSGSEVSPTDTTYYSLYVDYDVTEKTPFYELGYVRSDYEKGPYGFASGYDTAARGYYSHAQNVGTIAYGRAQTVIGRYNALDTGGGDADQFGAYAFIIGNGTADTYRKNALTVDWNGNLNLAGKIKLSGGTNTLLRYYSVTTAKTTIQGNTGALCQATFTMPAPYTHVIGVRQVSTNHAVATGINTFGVDGDGASGNTITCHAYVRNFNATAITDETVTFELFLASL